MKIKCDYCSTMKTLRKAVKKRKGERMKEQLKTLSTKQIVCILIMAICILPFILVLIASVYSMLFGTTFIYSEVTGLDAFLLAFMFTILAYFPVFIIATIGFIVSIVVFNTKSDSYDYLLRELDKKTFKNIGIVFAIIVVLILSMIVKVKISDAIKEWRFNSITPETHAENAIDWALNNDSWDSGWDLGDSWDSGGSFRLGQ